MTHWGGSCGLIGSHSRVCASRDAPSVVRTITDRRTWASAFERCRTRAARTPPKGLSRRSQGVRYVTKTRVRADVRSTSFPLCIPLSLSLPASFASRVASITYTLHATVELADDRQRRILRVSRSIQVVPPPATFSREWLQVRVGRGEVEVAGEGGGRVELCLTSDSLGAWAVEGGMVRVHAAVSNGSGHVVSQIGPRAVRG